MSVARPHFTSIWAIGHNYADHTAEMGGERPVHPVVFTKNVAAVIADGEAIVIPAICRENGPQVDYEGELGVIIGRDCRDAQLADALSYVSHYCVANDVSARWWQRHGSGGQFCRGKSFDTFCPIGSMTPAEQIPDPQALTIDTRLNDEIVQSSSTSYMIFPVATLIAELSRGTTLLAGTLILTGTPAGVGAGRKPPRFLRQGDRVRITISGVGSLENPVVEG